MKNFDYSVVIPAYKVNDTILQSIQSIEKQVIQPAEIIVVNDGNDPVLSELLNSSKVRIISTAKPRGPSLAKQVGVKEVKSEFFSILDGDDVWSDTFIYSQKAVWGAKSSACALVGGSFVAFGDSQADFFNALRRRLNQKPHAVSISELMYRNPFTASSVMFRTSSIESVGGWSILENSSDYATYAKLLVEGNELFFGSQIEGGYRVHKGQISQDMSKQYLGDLDVFNYLQAHSSLQLTRKQVVHHKQLLWFRALARTAVYCLTADHIPKPVNDFNSKILKYSYKIIRVSLCWKVLSAIWRLFRRFSRI